MTFRPHRLAGFRFRIALPLLLAASLARPLAAGAIWQPPVPQIPREAVSRISKTWKRLKSPNFEVVSDASPADVMRIVTELETFRSSLVTRFLTLNTASPVPTLVVIFKDIGEFAKFRPAAAPSRHPTWRFSERSVCVARARQPKPRVCWRR